MTRFLRFRLDQRWAVVAVGFVALSLAFSGRSMLSLAMAEWTNEFGWTKAAISGVMTATLVIMAGLAPLVGYAIDRSGPRLILTGGLLLVGASSAVLAGMESKLAFIIGFAGLGALGFGLVATHAVSSAVARSFEVGQGRAVGIATSGSTAGQFVFMPILGLVLAGGGWRLGYEALAGACLVVSIAAWWLLRNAAASALPRTTVEGTREGFATRLLYLVRRPTFHGLFWSFLLCGFTTTGVVETHLIPYAQFCGIPPAPGALAFGILMGVNTLAMVASGYLTDRMNRALLLASIYFFRSFTFLILPLLVQETAILWVFAVVFGIFDYATVPPTASLAVSHLGTARVGTAMGLISAGHSIGAALGAFAGGYLFDATGGYGWLWSSSFGLALAAAAIAGLVPARNRAVAAVA